MLSARKRPSVVGCQRTSRAAAAVCALAVPALSLSVCSALAACGDAPTPRSPRPTLLVPVDDGAATGARLRWYPRAPATLVDRLSLANGDELFLDERGDRYRLTGKQLRTTLLPAPRSFALLRQRTGGVIRLWARDGSTWEANGPLDEPKQLARHPSPLRALRLHGQDVFALDERGELLVAAEAGEFVPAPFDHGAFVPRFVALAPVGASLRALAMPERRFELRAGRFVALDQRPSGMNSLQEPARTVLRRPAQPTQEPLPRGPSARALEDGDATVVDGTYVEFERNGTRIELLHGPFGESLERTALTGLNDCVRPLLAGGSGSLYALCQHAAGSPTLALFHATAPWSSFKPIGELRVAGRPRLVVGADGAAWLSGVCQPAKAAKPAEPCDAPMLLRLPAGGGRVASVVQLPPGTNAVWAIAPGADPQRLLLVAERRRQRVMLVSRDGGREFVVRPLPDELHGELRAGQFRDGVLAVQSADLVALVDEDGRVRASISAPADAPHLVASGARVVAFDRRYGALRESLDAGATFSEPQRWPRAACDREECRVSAVCVAEGCVVGEEFVRVGWGDAGGALREPVELRAPSARLPHLRCTADATLTSLTHAPLARPLAAAQVLRRGAEWVATSEDGATLEASALRGRRASDGALRIDSTPLLVGPAKRGVGRVLVGSSAMGDGVAAMRVRLDGSNFSEPVVAWEPDGGRAMTATLDGELRWGRGDFVWNHRVISATPALLWVRGDALLTQLAANSSGVDLDARGKRVRTVVAMPGAVPVGDGVLSANDGTAVLRLPNEAQVRALISETAPVAVASDGTVAGVVVREPQPFGGYVLPVRGSLLGEPTRLTPLSDQLERAARCDESSKPFRLHVPAAELRVALTLLDSAGVAQTLLAHGTLIAAANPDGSEACARGLLVGSGDEVQALVTFTPKLRGWAFLRLPTSSEVRPLRCELVPEGP